jgi:mannose-6-phosphate isomerase-like protein (cupin superfamily)
LFYVIAGSGTMLTGGTITDGKPSGANVQGTTISGGTRLAFNPGDFIMVPSGVPHQFVDLAGPVQVMSMYLPNAK